MKKKILVIEDDPFLGDVLSQKMTHDGHAVTWIRDGGEGLREISTSKPDVILLDLMLPTLNGYEILEAKQKDKTIASIPVIIISNSGQPFEINRAITLGAKDYIVKAQIEPEEVSMKIQSALNGDRTPNTAHEHHLKGIKILWIEDDEFLGELIGRKLEKEGAISIHAKNGEEALTMLEKEIPNVILTDLVLPGMSGFDVLEKIRSNPVLKAIPIIVLSNLSQQADVERARKLGAAKHLIKAELDLDGIAHEISSTLETSQGKAVSR